MRATGIPIRIEHEVVDNELAAAVKEIGERLPALAAFEDIFSFDALPRQRAPLAIQLIAKPRKFLLPGEVRLARRDPFIVRNHGMSAHEKPGLAYACVSVNLHIAQRLARGLVFWT